MTIEATKMTHNILLYRYFSPQNPRPAEKREAVYYELHFFRKVAGQINIFVRNFEATSELNWFIQFVFVQKQKRKRDRDQIFVHLVIGDAFLRQKKQAKYTLSIFRTYLRVLSKKNALCSELYSTRKIFCKPCCDRSRMLLFPNRGKKTSSSSFVSLRTAESA